MITGNSTPDPVATTRQLPRSVFCGARVVNNLLHVDAQLGQVLHDHRPDGVKVHAKVGVNQAVACSRDLPPRYLGGKSSVLC